MFSNWIKFLSTFAVVLLMVSVSQTVMADADKPEETADSQSNPRVIMLIGEAQDFTGCRELGKVTGQSEESDNEKPYPNRLIIARTNLQKAVVELGGNTVHVLSSNTTRFDIPGVTKQIIFSGVAYACK